MLQFDPFLFTQIGLDSGALTMLGAVIHQFPNEGVYRGGVLQQGVTQGTFELQVTSKVSALQTNIDLATIGSAASNASADQGCSCSQASQVLQVHPKGSVVFHVSGGAGGYAAVVAAAEASPEELVFDSRKLQHGDMFAATVLRPGSYRAEGGTAKCEFSVAYPPAPGKEKYAPPAALQVAWHQNRFEPASFDLQFGQGILFRVDAQDARITIALEKADDGPSGPARTRTGLHIA